MHKPMRFSMTIVFGLAACFAVASTAQAGGYAGNGCVGKKQAALGKYTKSVGQAWAEYPADMTARDAAIAEAFAKVETTWDKEEEKAVTKNATCNESTSTDVEATDAASAAIAAVTAEDFEAVAGYIGDALKGYGKYTKDPVKDPGKLKLGAALAKASLKHLAGANMAVTTAASNLQAELVRLTTTAPNYPDSYQTIAYAPSEVVTYNKVDLSPTCIDGDPYMFFAKRGASNNVLMYYQGGGACWSKDACFEIPPAAHPPAASVRAPPTPATTPGCSPLASATGTIRPTPSTNGTWSS